MMSSEEGPRTQIFVARQAAFGETGPEACFGVRAAILEHSVGYALRLYQSQVTWKEDVSFQQVPLSIESSPARRFLSSPLSYVPQQLGSITGKVILPTVAKAVRCLSSMLIQIFSNRSDSPVTTIHQ
jgi:hypothetical protein